MIKEKVGSISGINPHFWLWSWHKQLITGREEIVTDGIDILLEDRE